MGFGSYKQYDSRWGSKNYNGSSNMATAGCGATSCANILHAIDSSITPITTMKYMQKNGFAIRNNGTAWNGIPSCLKAYGLQDVQLVSSMANVWKLMKKGYVGVFLFSSGSKGGVTWTTSGHYIAVCGYKYENGKHYVKTIDSGSRNHSGWYCYETTMKGLIPRIWLGKIKSPDKLTKPVEKYDGKLPTKTIKNGSTNNHVRNWQQFLRWYGASIDSVDGKFGNKTEYATKEFQITEELNVDGIVGKNTRTKAKAYIK